jgi:hypothetical protein
MRNKRPMPFELKFVVSLRARECGLDVGCYALRAVGIEGVVEVLASGIGVFGVEDAVIQADF